jgi:predicted transposase YbfD/YdcC
MKKHLMESPMKYFAAMEDYRKQGYVKHKMINIIAISIAAVICGAEDWYDIEDYGKEKYEWLKTFLDLSDGVPSHDTYNRFFSFANAEALEGCFEDWINAIANLSEGRIISIDGKTLRGSKGADRDTFIHMVSAWCNANNLVLGQQKVDDKSNEITAIPVLLELLVLKGCIITIDAMGCQKEIAEKIADKEADYILAVKGNQKFLLDDIEEAFSNARADDEYTHKEVDHGRIETRTTQIITDVDWICSHQDWKKLYCIIRVFCSRINKKTGVKEEAFRYYISSKKGTAKYFNHAIRAHWGIENKLHWMLDVTFGEDNSKKQAENAAQNFSLISKIALNMIRNLPHDLTRGSKVISAKRKRKMAAWNNKYLLKILLSFNPHESKTI